MKGTPVARLVIAAGMLGWLCAAAAAQEYIRWGEDVKYGWHSFSFVDENGKGRHLWFYRSAYAPGDTIPLYIFGKRAERRDGNKSYYTFASSQLSAYEAVLQEDKTAVIVKRNGASLEAYVENYLYEPDEIRARDSADYYNAPRPMGERETPRPTPMAAFKALPRYIPLIHDYEWYYDREKPGTHHLICRRFLPMEILLGTEGFLLQPDLITGDSDWRKNPDDPFKRITKMAGEGDWGEVDKYVLAKREEIRKAVSERLKEYGEQKPDPLQFSAFEIRLMLLIVRHAEHLKTMSREDFYAPLNEAVDNCDATRGDEGMKPLEDLVASRRDWIKRELEFYLAESEVRPGKDLSYYKSAMEGLDLRAKAANTGESLDDVYSAEKMALEAGKIKKSDVEKIEEKLKDPFKDR